MNEQTHDKAYTKGTVNLFDSVAINYHDLPMVNNIMMVNFCESLTCIMS